MWRMYRPLLWGFFLLVGPFLVALIVVVDQIQRKLVMRR